MKNANHRKLNNCLRKYRKARGLKQRDVARILKLRSTSMISRWEKGACFPDSQNIIKLSILYRTMVDALFIDHVRYFREDIFRKETEVFKASQT